MEQAQEIKKPEINKTQYNMFICLIYSITVAIIGIVGFFNKQPISNVVKFILLMIIIIAILFNVMNLYKIELFHNKYNLLFFSIAYFISLILTMASTNYEIYNIWIIGSALVAVLIYPYFGLVFHFIFSFLFCVVNSLGMEHFAFYFIIGAIICVFAQHIINPKTVMYVIIIALSCNVTLIFILNNFSYSDSINKNALFSIASTLVVIGMAFFSKRFKSEEGTAGECAEEEIKDTFKQEIPSEEFIESVEQMKIGENMNGENELLKRLENYSKDIYMHSVDVAELSARAAKLIGCNEEITRAGGLYHEIGRIVSKNYIEEGVNILTEQRFPQAVVEIIKQHNSKYEKPKSPEAAIVMLTDSILSTMEYIEKMPNKKKISTKDLVENIFQIRVTKGTLDESDISEENITLLKEYYIKNCF